MGSLVPGTHYKVGVYAVKEALKSNPTVTEFTTGRLRPHALCAHSSASSRTDSNRAAFADVDPPRDLKAVNVQADGATLTWKPPQAAVTGYTLTFTADGVIRVRRPPEIHHRTIPSFGFLLTLFSVRFGSTQEVVLSPTASSYAMSQLAASTEYSVRLQAIAGAQRSRHVDASFMTSRDQFSFLSSLKTSFFFFLFSVP